MINLKDLLQEAVKPTDNIKARMNILSADAGELISSYVALKDEYDKLSKNLSKDVMSKVEMATAAVYGPHGHKVFSRGDSVYINWKGTGGPNFRSGDKQHVKNKIESMLGETGAINLEVTKKNTYGEAKQIKVTLTAKYKKRLLNIPSWTEITRSFRNKLDKYRFL